MIGEEVRAAGLCHLAPLSSPAEKTTDRLAALLVLLYAQDAAKISRLTLDHVDVVGSDVRIRLGGAPIVVPEPLDGLVLTLIGSRRGHATLGDQGTSPWLFPGGRPGQPLSAYQLACAFVNSDCARWTR